MLNPHITLKLSRAKTLNDAAEVWVQHPQEMADYLFVISSPGPGKMHWPASLDLDGGGYLRSVFAYDQLHFVSHYILHAMATEDEIQIPVDYSIGFDINAAQYLRRLVEGSTHDPILRFKRSLQKLAHRRFNWELFPFLQERAEAILEGRDLQDIWNVVHASEKFAHSDIKHFSATGELQCQTTDIEITVKTQRILADWHQLLVDGEMDRIKRSHLMLHVLLLKIALLHRLRPATRDAGRNLAEFLAFMCGEVGVSLPWMLWAAVNLFEEGGRFEPLRKLTEPASSLVGNCKNVAWDFMHYFYRRQQARCMGQDGAFLVPYTLTFDRGLAALFAGHGQRSCLLREDDFMGQFFAEYDPQSEVIDKYSDCPALRRAIDQHLTMDAHLARKQRIETQEKPNRHPLLEELVRQCERLK